MTLPDPGDCAQARAVGRHPGVLAVLGLHLALSLAFLALLGALRCSGACARVSRALHPSLKVGGYCNAPCACRCCSSWAAGWAPCTRC